MAKNTNAQRVRQEAAQRRQDQENKTFYTLVAVTLALVVVIGGGIFLFRTVRDAATLPTKIRNTSRIQDDWIVIDADNTTGVRYHHPASFTIPQGYTQGSFYTTDGTPAQDFYITADDGNAAVASVYVYGAPELTAEENIQRIIELHSDALTEGTSDMVGDAFTAEIAGETAQCIYLHYTTDQGDYGCLICNFDAPRNVCVTAILSGAYTTPENVQTQEQLLTEAQTLLAGLTIIR